jgi:hypothetical protein
VRQGNEVLTCLHRGHFVVRDDVEQEWFLVRTIKDELSYNDTTPTCSNKLLTFAKHLQKSVP